LAAIPRSDALLCSSVDPKPSNPDMLLAPPPLGSSGALRFPPAREPEPPPRIDEHLVQPETRAERRFP
jgi:hypothetical protein